MPSKKKIGIFIIVIGILVIAVTWGRRQGSKKYDKEVLNCEYHILKEEYDSNYNTINEKIEMKKGYSYKFSWNVTLSEGTCDLDVTSKEKERLWNKKVSSDSFFEKDVVLSCDRSKKVNITMLINKETNGEICLIVKEYKK